MIGKMDESTSHGKQEVVLELNFVPKWAREPPGNNPYAHFEGRGERGDDRGRDRGERRPSFGRPGEKRGGKDRRHGPGSRSGPGRPDDRRGRPPFPQRDRDPQPQRPERPYYERREREVPPVSISFIPERTRLGAVVRELRQSGRAFPLMDLAAKFLSHPSFYLVKFEAHDSRDPKHSRRLYQCRECKMLFLERADLLAHALKAHLDKYFTREEIKVDPPAGNFVCVARCRLSGILLGPPNYHSYADRLQEIWRTRFPHMSLDEYRGHIETVREPELIEKWKQECCSQVVFKDKAEETGPTLKQAEAEKIFMEKHAASFVGEGNRLIVPADIAARFEDRTLKRALQDAWQRESYRPFSLILALRPAFHHMHLSLFKTSGGITFVTAVAPHPIDPGQTVSSIAEVLAFLQAHPGCTKQQLVEGLKPGLPSESPEIMAVMTPLRWLIEKGHVIEFFDGTLSLPNAGRQKPAQAADNGPRTADHTPQTADNGPQTVTDHGPQTTDHE